MTKIIICPTCKTNTEQQTLNENLNVCPSCSYHFRMEPAKRLAYLVDQGSFREFSENIRSMNPLAMKGYTEKLDEAMIKTRLNEAIITGTCTIESIPIVLAIMTFSFMSGSMGSVVGEKITRAMMKGLKNRCAVIIYVTSKGTRLQEGILSLMQMAKTASAAAELDKKGIPFFLILCDPTKGSVMASFAMLGDIIIAEPEAFVGFVGPRILEGTIKQPLQKEFQRAEFILKKGFVDYICARKDQRKLLAQLLRAHRI